MNDMNASSLGSAGGGADLTQRFSLDTQGFDALRQTAKNDPKAALKTVAKEMNASFLQMMLKSMRDATPSDGLMDSQDGKTFTSMLDGQLTQQMSSKGVGLADSLLKQLGGLPNAHGADAAHGALPMQGSHSDALHALDGNVAGNRAANNAHAVERTTGTAGTAVASAKLVAGMPRADAPLRAQRSESDRIEGAHGVQGTQASRADDGWASGLYRDVKLTGAVGVASAAGATKIATSSIDTTGIPEGARGAPLTMQQRVAAVEARAMAAGWRPPEGAQTAALATEAEEAAAAVGGAGAISAYAAAQRKPLGSAKAFEEQETQSIRMNGGSAHANAFIEKLAPAAEAASRETGIPAHFILSQVALESGWGKSEIRTPGGMRTHNVLGVKAGDGWTGPTVHAYTTEYVHGRAQHVREEFRVYGSYKEALQDYANVLTSNTRYASALRNSHSAAGFANGMQRAGYATDPHYASKLLAIIKQMV